MKTRVTSHLRATIFLSILFAIACFEKVSASPVSDLASTNQEVRDAAAKILREAYVPPARSNWDSLAAKLKPGTQKTNVWKILGPITNYSAGAGGSGVTITEQYRLDDVWILQCFFAGRGTNCLLTGIEFKQAMRFVDVEPPAKFTGDWRIYYVNGHIFSEGQYKNGRAEGKGVVFFPDGKKLMEQTVSSAKGKFEVEETSYYPSGSVKHKGHYEDNKQAGTWTWYNEDGSVQSKREFPNPQN